MIKPKDFDKEINDVRIYPKSGILQKNPELNPVELVLLLTRRAKELRAEGIRDDNGVQAMRDFELHPEHIAQTRENLIDSFRKNLPEKVEETKDNSDDTQK